MYLLPILILAIFACATAQTHKGLYWWTWSQTVSGADKLNMGVAFSGWVDPTKALGESKPLLTKLPGTKYISLGGGNANGRWTSGWATAAGSACTSGLFSGWEGVVFDIEEGDPGLTAPFRNAFAACKSKGFKIIVTISHSAPYGVTDAPALMAGFFADPNIDFLSPQLYTSGNEGANDWDISQGVTWNLYAKSKAQILPSIVTGHLYDNAHSVFATYGVNITGYIQWAQTVTDSQ